MVRGFPDMRLVSLSCCGLGCWVESLFGYKEQDTIPDQIWPGMLGRIHIWLHTEQGTVPDQIKEARLRDS